MLQHLLFVYLLQVFCTVTAFRRGTPEQQSLPEDSKDFYAGIKVMPTAPSRWFGNIWKSWWRNESWSSQAVLLPCSLWEKGFQFVWKCKTPLSIHWQPVWTPMCHKSRRKALCPGKCALNKSGGFVWWEDTPTNLPGCTILLELNQNEVKIK